MRATVLLLVATLWCTPGMAMDVPMPGVAHFSVKVSSIAGQRFATTTRQQYDFSCGSAALATLLTYHYGKPVTEAAVFRRMFTDGDQPKIRREGFSLLDMKRFLARGGLVADGFEQPLDKLFANRLPAIVLLSENGYHHFVVIKGGDSERVLLGDPSLGTRSLPRARFAELWPSKLLFVIHGYQGPVTFNGRTDWRAAPMAPLADAVDRSALGSVTLPRFGPGEF